MQFCVNLVQGRWEKRACEPLVSPKVGRYLHDHVPAHNLGVVSPCSRWIRLWLTLIKFLCLCPGTPSGDLGDNVRSSCKSCRPQDNQPARLCAPRDSINFTLYSGHCLHTVGRTISRMHNYVGTFHVYVQFCVKCHSKPLQ